VSRIELGFGLILAIACSRTPRSQEIADSHSRPSRSADAAPKPLPPAQFRLARVASSDSAGRRYVATSDDAPQNCKFEIRLEASKEFVAGTPFSITQVSLLRQPGADCTAFLRRIAKELAFTGDLPRPEHLDQLSSSIAILGTDQSRLEDPEVGASFVSTPPGTWTCGKLFLADGEGEVFLNLSEHEGLGEFSIKDEDYATIVVTELAKILLPKAG
jgi:hypothetical protein